MIDNMQNPYKKYLDSFFTTILNYRHTTDRLFRVLKNDVASYKKENTYLHLSSALIISDWSSGTDNGWEINFPTGIVTETPKNEYPNEIQKFLSREFCLIYAQSYEALERFFKDCMFNKAIQDQELNKYVLSLIRKKITEGIDREELPGGTKLFKILRKAGGETFSMYSMQNNMGYGFKDLWTVLSESRHAITHSKSCIPKSKADEHSRIFNDLFDSSVIDSMELLIELDYYKFDKLIKRVSEFAFQIFKILSIEDSLEWKLYK